MPQIIPIKELKNTSQISDRAHATSEPIYVTRNGYGDLVIMSVENYDRYLRKIEMYESLERAEKKISDGEGTDAREQLTSLRSKYGI